MTAPNSPTPNQMPGAAAAVAAAAAGGMANPNPPAATEPAATTEPASPAAPATAPAGDAARPPWEANGEEFNPERAWSLIQELRAKNTAQRTQLAAAQPILDAAEQARRDEQGELATVREDLARVTAREATWRGQAVRAKAEAMAAGRFIDAETALALIGDLSEYATDDGIDTPKLQSRLDQLATDKPFLIAAAPSQGFTPNRGQGQSGTPPLTAAQVAIHAESQQDWKTASAAKAQQLLELRK